MNVAVRFIRAMAILYFTWLGMLAVHESGHCINATLSGGRILAVSFPLFGFSQTFVDPNPHPLVVAWGGPLWGVILPSMMVVGFLIARKRPPMLLWFFDGFCLVANGAYIGLGWMKRSGDAHDLLRDGAPLFMLIAFGVVCVASGLLCWHQIPSDWWRLR